MSMFVTGGPRGLLRLEGLMVLIAAAISYGELAAGWGLFALLFLVPDITMAGYVFGRKAGAFTYNVGHCYAGPLAMLSLGLAGSMSRMTAIGLIWAAHIGFDRALGYGLKYSDGFGFSHLGRIGGMRLAANARLGKQAGGSK